MARIYRYGLTELRGCRDLSGLAGLVGVSPRFLAKQIYHTVDSVKYSSFSIPKKDGSLREIAAPNKNLKFIQSRLSRLLYQCYFDIHGSRLENISSALSHGFQRGFSIYSNASKHTGRNFVFNIDIEDFFHSINFGRVRGYFIKNKNFTLNETVANCISQTACFQNRLPQGAPTSPIISEFIAEILDHRLQSISKTCRCSYTRYADDITFSTNLRDFPATIAEKKALSPFWDIGFDVTKTIEKAGFHVNKSKIRMQERGQRQAVTGLTVNNFANISRRYYKGVRWCAHSMMTTGAARKGTSISPFEADLSVHQVWGMLTHVDDIKSRGSGKTTLRSYTPSNPAPHYLSLMGNFYHYKRIYLSEKPKVICEGKTDHLYLKEAIRWNIKDARVGSILADPLKLPVHGKKRGEWNVDFVRHSTMADRFLGLGGGGGDLKNFVSLHLQRISRFHANPNSRPTIIVVDNDDQSKGMWAAIKKFTGSQTDIDGSKPFYCVGNKIYVVPIPINGRKIAVIEDLIPENWLDYKLAGKSLKLKQKKGEKLHPSEYGKTEFAEKVIRAHRGEVDLSRFLPLLHVICDIIESG